MKKFLRVLIIFLVPVLILVAVTEILLRKIPNDYLYKRNYLDQHSNTIQTLFLGNSHVYYGIDPQYISGNSFNAAYVSQSFNYDLDILERYKNKWDSLRYIVLALDYPSLYGRLEKGTEAWRIKNYSIYYDINSSMNIADHTEVCNNNLKMTITRLSNYYVKHSSGITSSVLGWGNDYSSGHKKDLAVTGRAAAQRYNAYHSLNENIGSLRSIAAFAKARNITLVFFTPPGYSTYVSSMDTSKLDEAIHTAITATAGYSNSVYVNWLNDPGFVAGDYYDADHVNEIGTKKLSLKMDSVLSILKSRKAIDK